MKCGDDNCAGLDGRCTNAYGDAIVFRMLSEVVGCDRVVRKEVWDVVNNFKITLK
jgi:hypothetical protein